MLAEADKEKRTTGFHFAFRSTFGKEKNGKSHKFNSDDTYIIHETASFMRKNLSKVQ